MPRVRLSHLQGWDFSVRPATPGRVDMIACLDHDGAGSAFAETIDFWRKTKSRRWGHTLLHRVLPMHITEFMSALALSCITAAFPVTGVGDQWKRYLSRLFAYGHPIWVRPARSNGLPCADIVRRALTRLGENRYRFFSNNCEHLSEWCVNGEGRSPQVDRFLTPPRRVLRALLVSLPHPTDIQPPVLHAPAIGAFTAPTDIPGSAQAMRVQRDCFSAF